MPSVPRPYWCCMNASYFWPAYKKGAWDPLWGTALMCLPSAYVMLPNVPVCDEILQASPLHSSTMKGIRVRMVWTQSYHVVLVLIKMYISGTALTRSETMCWLPNIDPNCNQRFHYLTVKHCISQALWYHKCRDSSLDMWQGLFFVVDLACCMCIAVSSFILLLYLDLYWHLKYRCISLPSVCTLPVVSCTRNRMNTVEFYIVAIQTYIYIWISIWIPIDIYYILKS